MRDQVLDQQADASSFEAVYQRLEEAVARLEAGGLTLEESIELYESGMRLARRCKQLLDAAELRVSELQEEFSTDMLDGEDAEEAD